MRKCYVLLASALLACCNYAFAQVPVIPPGGAKPGAAKPQSIPQIGHVFGKLIDASTGKPVEYASVALLRLKDSSVIGGMLSKSNGDFSIEHLPFGPMIMRINFMGYKTVIKRVTITPQAYDQDLGNIKLQANVSNLSAVEVTGQKSAFTMGIDKKVFNVERNLVSAGGTATDILKNIPAVNVDIDGNIKVRNASPTVFVDGKPSTLTLDQIPADAIESVELITNPSAKYDAEGMAGILNIVLKKNKRAGINGMIMGGVGNNDKYNAGGNINVRQGKFNVFANYNFNASRFWGDGTTNRSNFNRVNGVPTDTNYLRQVSESRNGAQFQFGRFGLDYYLDNRNTLSVSQNIVAGKFSVFEDLGSEFLNSSKQLQTANDRVNNGDFKFRNYTTQVGFKHTFAKPNQEWTADFSYNRSSNDRDGNYVTQNKNSQQQPIGNPILQNNNGDGKTTFLTAQTDYVNPIGKNGKLEAGAKATIRDYTSNFNVYDQDNTGGFVFNNLLSNDYKYKEQIYAGYANFANTMGSFGYQAGLRVEQYIYSGEIPSEGKTFKPTKAAPGFFPSVYLSQKLKKDQELQLNYSRRVTRPNFFQLIPYRDYSDPQNQREGNPNLKPEYTNSLEFSYAKNFKAGNFLASIYYRNTNNLISTLSTPIGKDTLLSTFVNADKNNSYGAELTLKNTIVKGWDLTSNVNLYQTNLTVKSNEGDFKNNGFSWMAKLNSEVKLPANFTIQVNGTYQAPAIALPAGSQGGGRGGGFNMVPTTAQGTIKGFSTVDMAVRKDFLKNKAASLTLALSDVFNTRQIQLDQTTPQFAQDYIRKRESRIVRLNFSYRFGKFDAQIFKRKNLKAEREGMQNSMEGGQGF
ncbi:TonB-dependent receptor family protein [Chitinophaga pendula]|uniref:outer membrane beta-barrel family protein n=1 Tax=Chitinophaga TaxID=79328 RepID=UPI000BB07680|nr:MULTISPECIES: outer membrane beta-barrel family protein [Chitinophaga]ASZ12062.1 TonB-dependent receptor [Chitinophaga sp. MD30]UCJ04904.1 TonB-dependent receptor family protein [Chitinophaga pendula]